MAQTGSQEWVQKSARGEGARRYRPACQVRGYDRLADFFVEKLSEGVGTIAAAFHPKPVHEAEQAIRAVPSAAE